MRHRAWIAAAAAALLLAPAAFAAEQTAPAERLVVQTYPGDPPWKASIDPSDKDTRAWIPADQTSQAETKDLLTAQTFPKLMGFDPAEFARGFAQNATTSCGSMRVNGPIAQTENGVPVAYIQFYCVRFRDFALDVDCMMKVIGGKEALYVVQRIFRRPTGAAAGADVAAAQGVARDFLATNVRLCGAGDSDGVCAPDAP